MSKEILRIMDSFLTHIMLGTSLNDTKLELMTRKAEGEPWKPTECSIG